MNCVFKHSFMFFVLNMKACKKRFSRKKRNLIPNIRKKPIDTSFPLKKQLIFADRVINLKSR